MNNLLLAQAKKINTITMSADIQLLLCEISFNIFTTKSKVHQNPKYTMPSKYQTDQYPTHQCNST